MNIAPLGREATLEDLYAVEGNAELVDGSIVLMAPTSDDHNTAVGNIFFRLKLYQREHGGGRPYTDGIGFILNPRRSCSPDVAWYTGPRSHRKRIQGAPAFAVEVRSEEDYGPVAERRLAAKRADYFEAGTQVIWDVDVIREGWIRVYHADDPENPVVFARGKIADAEPALPGWRFPVDELFA
jgi:Uma2 family endonuclease